MKRTYQPSVTRRKRTHGFLVRMKTRNALDLGLTRQRNRAPVSAVAHYCGRALWPRAHALGFSGRLFTALKPQFF